MDAVYFGNAENLVQYFQEKYGKAKVDSMFYGKGEGITASFVYYPEINTFNGKENLQIIVRNYC